MAISIGVTVGHTKSDSARIRTLLHDFTFVQQRLLSSLLGDSGTDFGAVKSLNLTLLPHRSVDAKYIDAMGANNSLADGRTSELHADLSLDSRTFVIISIVCLAVGAAALASWLCSRQYYGRELEACAKPSQEWHL